MRKSYLILAAVTAVFATSTLAQAQVNMANCELYPRLRVNEESDCSNTRREMKMYCCPQGYRVQGVAYADINKQDHVDAVAPVCRSIARGNDMVASDFTRTPKQFVCDKTEVMAGIKSKDVRTEGGDDRDTLDGVTAVCQHPSSRAMRTVYNNDIDSNPRQARERTVSLPSRVVGIAYKETDNKGGDAGSSDRADCVTILTENK